MLIRRPERPEDLEVAIIGGGLMGHALAAIFLAHGSSITVCESSSAGRATLTDRVAAAIDTSGQSRRLTKPLQMVSSVANLPRNCDLVIEAVPEDLALKQALFSELEGYLPSAILATNSSVFCVGDVAAKMKDRTRAIGTHWWNPPHLMPIVEVIQGEQTGQDLVLWMMDLLQALGKTPVHVRKDTPGFIGNRLQHALWREAFALLEEGVADAQTIDLVVRQTIGLKLSAMGPLENADYVGLDLTRAIHQYVFPALSCTTEPSKLLDDAVQHGCLGAKSGRGLSPWPAGRREQVAERLRLHLLGAHKESI
jgi:3-hydroxybutyryl-CoA dehydrogenase